MKPMPMIVPSEGDVVSKFLNGARPDLKDYLTANTPAGYWTSAEQLFDKAINCALDNKTKDQRHVPHTTSVDRFPAGINAAMNGKRHYRQRTNRSGRAARAGKTDAPRATADEPPTKKAKEPEPKGPKFDKVQSKKIFQRHLPLLRRGASLYTVPCAAQER